MVSPDAIEQVTEFLDEFEMRGHPEMRTSCSPGTLEVWARELRRRDYKTQVGWTQRTWGMASSVVGQMGSPGGRDSRRIVVTQLPEPPQWVPVGEDPGERVLWINEPPEGKKVDVMVLIRRMRPEWSIQECRACMKGERPLFENVGMATSVQVIDYLSLVGWSVRVE